MTADATYVCDRCGKLCRSGAGLASHYRWYHGLDDACPLCGGGFGAACSWHFFW